MLGYLNIEYLKREIFFFKLKDFFANLFKNNINPFFLNNKIKIRNKNLFSESKVLIIGGEVEGNIDLSTVEIYDINQGFMEQLPPMPTAR